MPSPAAGDRIASLLRTQFGLIARAQALAAGLSSSAINRRIASGEWEAVLPGVYLVASHTLDPRGRLLAARLWLGADAVVHGHWAAWLHHLVESPRGPVTLTVARPLTPGRRPAGLVQVRRRTLAAADVARRSGTPVTTRALTALECADLPGGDEIMDRALQLGTTVASLQATLHRLRAARGAVAARRALWRVEGGEVSVAEREYRSLLRRGNVTALRPSVTIIACGQELTVDFASTRLKLAVEIDGWRVHSTGEAFHRDRAKQNLLELDLWTTLRYTPRQIRQEGRAVLAQTVQMIERLERRARQEARRAG
jgi:very-short-patch-repair endonuclease